LDSDSRRLSVTAPDLLARFRTKHTLEFRVDILDVPPDHFVAKVQGVAVGFWGATSPSGVISCEVSHGPRYDQKRSDGSIVVQLPKPQTATGSGATKRLELAGVDLSKLADPLKSPKTLPFWGHGVAGP
jgi:hypothetical protein